LGTVSAQTTPQTAGGVDPVGCSPTPEQATAGEPSDAIDPTTQDDDEPPGFLVSGQKPPNVGGVLDAVEAALAAAMCAATAAGRFDVVSQLARELEARRCARAGDIVCLKPSRRNGGDP
jgi:hypothetical protein